MSSPHDARSRTSPTRPEWLVENPRDGSLLALVPAGEFLMGGPAHSEGGSDRFYVQIPSYYLAIHPVTNVQYKRFVDATGHPPPVGPRRSAPPDGAWEGVEVREGMELHPVVGVSWDDAREYASWAGLRLPLETEWEKGARGVDGRSFPWGNDWDLTLSQNDESRKEQTTTRVWSHGAGCSVWGCYHMSGNVWEWCQDWFDPGVHARYSRGDLRTPQSGRTRVVRGGSWFNVGPESFLCSYRFHLRPDERGWQYGFRMARDV